MTTAYKINANGHVVSPAIQAAAAALMAKLNDPEVLFDASLTDTWRKTIAQGHTDGKPAYTPLDTPLDTPRKPAYVDFQDSVNTTAESINGSVGDRGSWSGSRRPYLQPNQIFTRGRCALVNTGVKTIGISSCGCAPTSSRCALVSPARIVWSVWGTGGTASGIGTNGV